MKNLHIAKPLVLNEQSNFNPQRNEILMRLNKLADELMAVEDHQISLLTFKQLLNFQNFLGKQATRFDGWRNVESAPAPAQREK